MLNFCQEQQYIDTPLDSLWPARVMPRIGTNPYALISLWPPRVMPRIGSQSSRSYLTLACFKAMPKQLRYLCEGPAIATLYAALLLLWLALW